jgi:hypothetical protein
MSMLGQCRHCARPVAWFAVRGNTRRPFDRQTAMRVDDVSQLGWVPVRFRPPLGPVIAIPIADLAEWRVVGVERVMMPHLCEQYLASRRHQVDAITEADLAAALGGRTEARA